MLNLDVDNTAMSSDGNVFVDSHRHNTVFYSARYLVPAAWHRCTVISFFSEFA